MDEGWTPSFTPPPWVLPSPYPPPTPHRAIRVVGDGRNTIKHVFLPAEQMYRPVRGSGDNGHSMHSHVLLVWTPRLSGWDISRIPPSWRKRFETKYLLFINRSRPSVRPCVERKGPNEENLYSKLQRRLNPNVGVQLATGGLSVPVALRSVPPSPENTHTQFFRTPHRSI